MEGSWVGRGLRVGGPYPGRPWGGDITQHGVAVMCMYQYLEDLVT